MSRVSLFRGAVLVASLAALGACAQSRDADSASPAAAATQQAAPAPPAQPTPAPSEQPTTFADDQLRAFAGAASEIDPISRSLPNATDEQRAQATEQIRAILARHNIDADTYNAIATQAQTDSALAARIRTLHEQSQPAQPQ